MRQMKLASLPCRRRWVWLFFLLYGLLSVVYLHSRNDWTGQVNTALADTLRTSRLATSFSANVKDTSSTRTTNSTQLTGETTIAAKSKYAYVFLLAGCDLEHPSYRGFLYNILISVRILRNAGSTSDVVVFIRMISGTAENQLLPKQEEEWLHKMQCRVIYLNPLATSETENAQSFNEVQMSKFHALQLTEYRRVLYLDADVMPVCNLDWIFTLSEGVNGEKPLIQENLVLAWSKEPANGGFFMLTPQPGDYEQAQDIIAEQKKRGQSLPYPHFDPVEGWGHAITGDDQWVTYNLEDKGKLWDFYAAYTDQGFCKFMAHNDKCSSKILTISMLLRCSVPWCFQCIIG